MKQANINNFLLLYNNNQPYQLTGSWCVHDGFKPSELLNPIKKEFIPDKILTYKNKCSANPGGNYTASRRIIESRTKDSTITHGLHPLPDGSRSRIASGLSVRRLPPVAITPLLIMRVTLSAD